MPADSRKIWPPLPRRRVYLLRHADVTYFDERGRAFQPDTVPVTELGLEQIASAREALAGIDFDLVLTSGLLRTRQTALGIVGPVRPTESEPRFREITTGRMSEWESAAPEDVHRTIVESLSRHVTRDSRFLAGETIGTCLDRVLSAWQELLARTDWQTVLIVAHGITNRLLLGECLGLPLGALGRLEQDACCINLIEVDQASIPLVRLLNHTAYNPGKRGMALSTLEGLYQQYLQGRQPARKE